jgi:SAM-dependent methyltransferase
MERAVSMSIGAWSAGIDHEAQFWHDWAQTKGARWPDEYARRLDPAASVDALIGEPLRRSGSGARLLDVGSGPLTPVGKRYRDAEFTVSACDPLARLYDVILQAAGIEPLVRTEFAVAEDLSAFYAPSSFDVVYCQNALDHSFDPVRGIIEMCRVVRVGGHVILRHSPNEAESECYVGFHQYNFDEQDGEFVIWNKKSRVKVADAMPIAVDITCRRNSCIEVVIKKIGEFPDHASRSERDRARIRELHEDLIGFFVSPAIRNISGEALRHDAEDTNASISP